MNTCRVLFAMTLVLVVSSTLLTGCGTSSGRESRSVTISESSNGNGLVVAMSEGLARSLLEGVVGSEIECGSEIDGAFETMLKTLDRGGKGSRASIRDEDAVIAARRSGASLKMKIGDLDSGTRITVEMPWAMAECMLDGSAELTAGDAGAVRIKITGADGGSFEFTVD